MIVMELMAASAGDVVGASCRCCGCCCSAAAAARRRRCRRRRLQLPALAPCSRYPSLKRALSPCGVDEDMGSEPNLHSALPCVVCKLEPNP